MAQGTWEDFSSKYGFLDGNAAVDALDVRTRQILVNHINEVLEAANSPSRAFCYDRPGMHNSLLILFGPAGLDDAGGKLPEGVGVCTDIPEELLRWLETNKENDVEGPGHRTSLDEMVCGAYNAARSERISVDRAPVEALIESVDAFLEGDFDDRDAQERMAKACDDLKGAIG